MTKKSRSSYRSWKKRKSRLSPSEHHKKMWKSINQQQIEVQLKRYPTPKTEIKQFLQDTKDFHCWVQNKKTGKIIDYPKEILKERAKTCPGSPTGELVYKQWNPLLQKFAFRYHATDKEDNFREEFYKEFYICCDFIQDEPLCLYRAFGELCSLDFDKDWCMCFGALGVKMKDGRTYWVYG